jgi:hypothetical protein
MRSASPWLLGAIVDVEEPETGSEAVGPLEIIHQASMEIAAHRHALRRRALQLRQVATQEHDAVGVVDQAVGGRHIRGHEIENRYAVAPSSFIDRTSS